MKASVKIGAIVVASVAVVGALYSFVFRIRDDDAPSPFLNPAGQLSEAGQAYRAAMLAEDAGNLMLEKSELERVIRDYGSQMTVAPDHSEISYRDVAQPRLNEVNCSLNFESANPHARTAAETVQQLLEALKQKNRAVLLELVSCSISEGLPEGNFESSSRDRAVDHLLGKVEGGMGIAPGTPPYAYRGEEGHYQVIANADSQLDLMVKATAFAPQTNRIEVISWGALDSE